MNQKGEVRMSDLGGFADKAKEFAGEHPDQVDKGVEKAGDLADEKTGGRFDDQIQEGEQRAEDYLGTGGQGDQGQGGQGDQGSQNQ
jgi:hypothetical protein